MSNNAGHPCPTQQCGSRTATRHSPDSSVSLSCTSCTWTAHCMTIALQPCSLHLHWLPHATTMSLSMPSQAMNLHNLSVKERVLNVCRFPDTVSSRHDATKAMPYLQYHSITRLYVLLSGGCISETSANYEGTLIRSLRGQQFSQGDCCDYCKNTTGCNVWTWCPSFEVGLWLVAY